MGDAMQICTATVEIRQEVGKVRGRQWSGGCLESEGEIMVE